MRIRTGRLRAVFATLEIGDPIPAANGMAVVRERPIAAGQLARIVFLGVCIDGKVTAYNSFVPWGILRAQDQAAADVNRLVSDLGRMVRVGFALVSPAAADDEDAPRRDPLFWIQIHQGSGQRELLAPRLTRFVDKPSVRGIE